MSIDTIISAITSKDYHPVTHVIFDFDGLLVNTEEFYTKAITGLAASYGKTFDFNIKAAMMGKRPIESSTICLEMLGLTDKVTPENFVTQYETEVMKNSHKIELMPGVRRLIEYLVSKKVPMAIATGSAQPVFEKMTRHIGDILYAPFSHHVFSGSDPEVKRGKPHPDVFLIAAQRFRDPPKDMKSVLVFEDAINGVKAARAAGMQVVMVPDLRLLRVESAVSDLTKCKPTEILTSLLHFEPNRYGLPKFD